MSEARELVIIQVLLSYCTKLDLALTFDSVCLCLGAIGPLPAGYMLAGGYSWRLFFYVEAAFAGALFVMAFLFVEESRYDRTHTTYPYGDSMGSRPESKEAKLQHDETVESFGSIPPRKSYLSTLKPWSTIDHEAEFFMTMLRPFTYFFIPAVFWVIASYGIYPPKKQLRNANPVLQESTLVLGL